jgi:hypothetical protein
VFMKILLAADERLFDIRHSLRFSGSFPTT